MWRPSNRFFAETVSISANTTRYGASRDVGVEPGENCGIAAYNVAIIALGQPVTLQLFCSGLSGGNPLANPGVNSSAWQALTDRLVTTAGVPLVVSVPIFARINNFAVTFGATAPTSLLIRSSFTAA